MLIYFSNEISSMVGNRANAVLRRGRMETSLYDEVWAIRRDGFSLCSLGLWGS